MAPLAGDSVRAFDDATVNHDSASSARADNHTEHHAGTGGRTIDRFGQREAVGVVRHSHGPTEKLLQIFSERLSNQPERVGVLHQSGRSGNRARDPYANGATSAEGVLEIGNETANRFERALIVAARGGCSRRERTSPPGDNAMTSIFVPPTSTPMRTGGTVPFRVGARHRRQRSAFSAFISCNLLRLPAKRTRLSMCRRHPAIGIANNALLLRQRSNARLMGCVAVRHLGHRFFSDSARRILWRR